MGRCVLAIVGPPRSGKTTLSGMLTLPVVHTDRWRDLSWDDQPYAVFDHLSTLDMEYAIEGCMVSRLLKRGLSPRLVVHLLSALGSAGRPHRQRSIAMGVSRDMAEWVWKRDTYRLPVELVETTADEAAHELRRRGLIV